MKDKPELQSQLFYQKGADTLPKKHSLPKVFSFTYKAHDGIKYTGWCLFDWKEITQAFREVVGGNPQEVRTQLAIRINYHNTLLTARIIGSNGKEVFIEPKKIDISKVHIDIQEEKPPFD